MNIIKIIYEVFKTDYNDYDGDWMSPNHPHWIDIICISIGMLALILGLTYG